MVRSNCLCTVPCTRLPAPAALGLSEPGPALRGSEWRHHYARFEFKKVARESSSSALPENRLRHEDVPLAEPMILRILISARRTRLALALQIFSIARNSTSPPSAAGARSVVGDAIIARPCGNAAEIVNGWRYTMGGGLAPDLIIRFAPRSPPILPARMCPRKFMIATLALIRKAVVSVRSTNTLLDLYKDKTPPFSASGT